MNIKILNLVLVICLISLIDIKAQPYIFFSTQITDTSNGILEKVVRYNLTTNSVEDFIPQQIIGEYAQSVWDPSQSYLIIEVSKLGFTLYDCTYPSIFYDLEIRSLINEMLYSDQRNNLYIYSDDYGKLSLFNFSVDSVISEIDLGKTAYPNFLTQPSRCSFFSSDNDNIYFFNVDTNNVDQVWTYSFETNQITNKQNLLELGGHAGALGYSLKFGRKGKGIIESYPVYYGNPYRDYYYKFYDFDADTSSPFIYQEGEAEAYFNGNGEFLLILETTKDTSDVYYHTGVAKIYNTSTGQLYKTLNVPAGGKIYTFDNYPNDIYYVLNLDTEPEIYNLTKLKLNSISPAMTFPSGALEYWFTVTLTGDFFTDSSVVYYNGSVKPIDFVSDTVVTFIVNSSDISFAGSYPVWVSNYGSNSDTLYFSVVNSLPQQITPILECIEERGYGKFTAYFGYENNNSLPVFIRSGSNNRIFSQTKPSSIISINNQPTVFLPGRQVNVFNVVFNGNEFIWRLVGQDLPVDEKAERCQ